jgi:signal transduction histidine kinase
MEGTDNALTSHVDDLAGIGPAPSGKAAVRPIAHVRDALGRAPSPQLAARLENAFLAASLVAGGAHGDPFAESLAALEYARTALVELGAEGELGPDDVHAAVSALTSSTGAHRLSVEYALYAAAVAHPRLLELPPLAAAGFQLRFLRDLDVVANASLWRRSPHGQPECVLQVGAADIGRRTRAQARAALRGRRSLGLAGRSALVSAPVLRFQQIAGAVVAQTGSSTIDRAASFLQQAAQALGPVLERELLLERSRERERALASSAERRLTRLAFDLHDGPIQDVLALAAEVRQLQQELYPFVLDSHRELAFGRFDDVSARLAELDRVLREISHSLESKSIVSRPLGEILHRETDAFSERTAIDARLELRGDLESLDSAQRITVYRVIQEALANVREHSGATTVDIRVRARRNSIEVRIVDNGTGFEVSRSLARAAKRGRLGLVGMGERVRMLGGSFELESRPGGPTTVSFTLPR